MKDQAYDLRNLIKNENDNGFQVITITSGKGGVGKTSFTVNLASCLQSLGKKVLILDADLALANIDIMLDEKPLYNLGHVLTGEKNINEIIYTSKSGIKFIPASSGVEELANLTKQQQLFILNSLKDIYYDFDYMFIDTSAGIHETVVNFCLAADKTVVVTTPDPTAIADAYALSRILSKHKPETMELGLMVNVVSSAEEGEKIYKGMDSILKKFTGNGIEFYGYLRKDNNLIKSVRDRKILYQINPKSKYSQDILTFANFLISGKRKSPEVNFWKEYLIIG
ncbi:MinD/ParA family protein [Hydrogenivirga sp. 128-5-R1-1]|uniref:MinD/ParA family protein n=1 Tax=Hydrogenivirga sp. 128-5-R1-1 TaxID=392423 RepID=UPI00015EF6A2|nr:MinD/ParA family protein [Hydrogenivirga sp. 128-5-R1-1]EDP73172.1 flagellar synthesis regulator [Hydrogenivirga sp. 128-5-R1-1]